MRLQLETKFMFLEARVGRVTALVSCPQLNGPMGLEVGHWKEICVRKGFIRNLHLISSRNLR